MTIEELKNHIKSFKSGEISSDEITKYFQEFIDGDSKIINSYYLKTTNELKPLYSFLVYHRKDVFSRLKFPKSYKPKNAFSHLTSVEAIQKFIDDNNILSPGDMEKRFRGANTMRSKLSVEDQNKIKWPQYSRLSFRNIKTIEDLQKLIDRKDIRQPIELKTKISDSLYGLYYRKFSREERSNIRWKNDRPIRKLPNKFRDWSSVDSIEKLQQIVDDNQVVNKTDLSNRFRGLYKKFRDQLSKIKFAGPLTLTRGEAFLIKELLIKYNINFLYQKTYPDCKKVMACRFDFYLIDYNILLEYHGEAHFGDGIRYTEELIENDKLKNKYAKDHGIPIYYFTLDKKLYDEVGYFDKIYTDIDELIFAMGINTTQNPDYKKDLQSYFSQDIDYFNAFIIRNKVRSLKDLRKRFSTVATRVRERGLKEYLVYYVDS